MQPTDPTSVPAPSHSAAPAPPDSPAAPAAPRASNAVTAPAAPHAAAALSTPRPDDWRKWVITLFGAGFSPIGPGTAGSFVAAAIMLALYLALGAAGALSSAVWLIALLVGLLAFSALCIWFGPFGIAYFGREDPGGYVLDEAAGICLTFLFLPMLPGAQEAWVALAAFAAFRLFDISKIWPVKKLENLPLGWGILLDDLAAAVYANVACQLLVRLVILPRL